MDLFLWFEKEGFEKDVPNGVRQKQSGGLFLGRGSADPSLQILHVIKK